MVSNPKNDQHVLSFIKQLNTNYLRIWFELFFALLLVILPILVFLFFQINNLLLFYSITTLWWGFFLHYLILFEHEASHFNLHHNRKINDLICNLLVSSLFGRNIEIYRKVHSTHHKWFGEIEDLEKTYKDKLNFIFILKCLSGWKVFSEVVLQKKNTNENNKNLYILYTMLIHTAMLSLLFYLGGLLFSLSWIISIVSVFPLIASIRQLLEHKGLESAELKNFQINLFSYFFGGVGFCHHAVHHLYPQVSYTQLKKLKEYLAINNCPYHETTTYFREFKRLFSL